MEMKFTLYNGKSIQIGEKIWYGALETEIQMENFSTKLAQILLTHRPTDYLLVISDGKNEIMGMCWGRKLPQILHLDRLFIFPKFREKRIGFLVISFFVDQFKRVMWRAVHDAMDKIAHNLQGTKQTIDGYRGWVISAENLPNGYLEELSNVQKGLICSNCMQEVPIGQYCGNCGKEILS